MITGHFSTLKRSEIKNGVQILRVPVLFRREMQVANIVSMISYLPSSVYGAIKNVPRGRFDIINTHFAIPSGPTGGILSKMYRLPNILSIHGGDIYDPSKKLSPHKTPILSHTVRAVLKDADRVVAQSGNTKHNAEQYYTIHRHIDVIPLGIKKPVIKKSSRSAFNLAPDELVLCTIGRLVKRKNIDDLLFALSGIKDNYNCKLLIIGDGPEKQHLMRLTEKMNLQKNVVMMGAVSDDEKYQILDVSDCFVSSAVHEGFGLVFLEAMETGKPIVCYDNGGHTDFMVNGKTGFIVTLKNRGQLKESILDIITNESLRIEMGRFNRNLVKKYYIRQCAEQYLKLFDQTIKNHKKKK